MARTQAVDRNPAGGDVIQTLRTSNPRIISAAAAVAILSGLAVYTTLRAGTLGWLVGGLDLAAALLVLGSLGGYVRLLFWGVALIGAGYVVVDLARGLPLLAAPFYGAGLLMVTELVFCSRELARVAEERPARRLPWLAVTAIVAFIIACVPLAATGLSMPGGITAGLLMLVSASALLAAPAILLRRRRPVPQQDRVSPRDGGALA